MESKKTVALKFRIVASGQRFSAKSWSFSNECYQDIFEEPPQLDWYEVHTISISQKAVLISSLIILEIVPTVVDFIQNNGGDIINVLETTLENLLNPDSKKSVLVTCL